MPVPVRNVASAASATSISGGTSNVHVSAGAGVSRRHGIGPGARLATIDLRRLLNSYALASRINDTVNGSNDSNNNTSNSNNSNSRIRVRVSRPDTPIPMPSSAMAASSYQRNPNPNPNVSSSSISGLSRRSQTPTALATSVPTSNVFNSNSSDGIGSTNSARHSDIDGSLNSQQTVSSVSGGLSGATSLLVRLGEFNFRDLNHFTEALDRGRLAFLAQVRLQNLINLYRIEQENIFSESSVSSIRTNDSSSPSTTSSTTATNTANNRPRRLSFPGFGSSYGLHPSISGLSASLTSSPRGSDFPSPSIYNRHSYRFVNSDSHDEKEKDTTEIPVPQNQAQLLVSMTDRCAERIKFLATRENNPNLKLRVKVVGGGCYGLYYGFDLCTNINDDDRIFTKHGSQVVVSENTLKLIAGSVIDFRDEGISSAFEVLENPNSLNRCACGSSFNVDGTDPGCLPCR